MAHRLTGASTWRMTEVQPGLVVVQVQSTPGTETYQVQCYDAETVPSGNRTWPAVTSADTGTVLNLDKSTTPYGTFWASAGYVYQVRRTSGTGTTSVLTYSNVEPVVSAKIPDRVKVTEW